MSTPAFTDVGSPQHPAVVFLHGVGGGRHGWAAQQAHVAALGWRSVAVADAKPVWRRAREKPRPRDRPRKPEPPPDPHSPFAGLAALRLR